MKVKIFGELIPLLNTNSINKSAESEIQAYIPLKVPPKDEFKVHFSQINFKPVIKYLKEAILPQIASR